jgi:ring-1,2-phenylacetyl-CoA epoxidase subunit PaaE
MEPFIPTALRAWVPRSVLEGAELRIRDAVHVVRSLRGDKPAPYELRTGRASFNATTPRAVETRRMRVTASSLETDDAVAIAFETEDGALLRAEAGQFMTVHWPVDGRIEKRAYSLSSAVDGSGRGRLVVKAVAGGLVSRALLAQVGALTHLEVTGPSGAFVLDEAASTHVLIAGGSGITPIASMLLTHVVRRPEDRFVLVYGSRSPRDAILRDELLALAASNANRLQILWAFDRDASSFDGGSVAHEGPLDEGALTRLLQSLPKATLAEAAFYLCGPAPMMGAADAVLSSLAVPSRRVRAERFASPGRAAAVSTPAKTVALRIRVGGKSLDVLGSTKQTILDAGLAAGLAMPYSCAMGGCGACKVRVASGPTQMDEPHCLDAAEADAGYVLACCTRPSGDVVVEVP